DAKREARKIAGVNEAVAIQELEQDNTKGALEEISRFGDNLHLTLQAFKEAGLSSAQVQDIIENSALMEVSLTGHPVNPRSSEYIKAVMDLDRVLETPDASYDD